jgi:endonuclease III
MNIAEQKQQVRYVTQNLEAAYGVPQNRRPEDPLESLVQTILSQSTSDANSSRAFASLKRRFPDWESACRARPASIAAAIRSGGLARVKSVVIKDVLNEVRARRGTLDLDFLRTAPLAAALDFLTSLKGIGPKTASCVLLFACRRPVFPLDTHILRITRRLGLVPERATDQQAHDLMARLVPPRKHFSLHVNLIRHGRRVCRPRDPLCIQCCLIEHCHYGQTHAL